MTTHSEVKLALFNLCLQKVEQRISEFELRLNSIQEARNNETKSSVGDKYETGRSMMQMEEQNFGVQLKEAQFERSKLKRLASVPSSEQVKLGSLVYTDSGNYYLCIGMGKMILDDIIYFCISIEAPIGRLLLNKRVKDQIKFNEKNIIIEQIH